MEEGGFLIKFDGKEAERCYACKFNYDLGVYTLNNNEQDERPLPEGVQKIEILLEDAKH